MTEAKNTSQTGNAMGVSSIDTGDQEAQANAMAKYYNDRGGLFGRKVVMRFDDHNFALLLSQPDSEAQVTCTRFTQDQPVIAVINTQGALDVASLRACFVKAGIPLLSTNAYAIDDKVIGDSHGMYIPNVASWTSLAPVLVNRLVEQGYFSGWDTTKGAPGTAPVVVGLIQRDDPDTAHASAVLQAALTRAGHAPAVVFKWTNFESDANSEVIAMRGHNVTHIIMLDPTLFAFATAAESQKYRPRYGVSSINGLEEEQGIAPAAQDVGAMGVGYQPTWDTATQSGEITPGGRLCRGIMTANGQTFGGKRYAESFAMAICDDVRVVAESALSARGFTGQAILAGLGRLGPGFAPGVTFGSGLGSPYPRLPGAIRDIRYQTACSCFQYAGTTLYPL